MAKARVAEVNAKYEEVVSKARAGIAVTRPEPIRVQPPVFSPVIVVGKRPVAELARTYLNRRSEELRG